MSYKKTRSHYCEQSQGSFFDSLAKELPPIIPRKDLPKYIGSLVSIGYMANLDSAGLGPQSKRIGGRVVYERESFVAWLEARSEKGAS